MASECYAYPLRNISSSRKLSTKPSTKATVPPHLHTQKDWAVLNGTQAESIRIPKMELSPFTLALHYSSYHYTPSLTVDVAPGFHHQSIVFSPV